MVRILTMTELSTKLNSWSKEFTFPIKCPLFIRQSALILLSDSSKFPRCFTLSTHGRGSPFRMIGASLSFRFFTLEKTTHLVLDFTGSTFVLNFNFILLAKDSHILTMACNPVLLADRSRRSSAYPRTP